MEEKIYVLSGNNYMVFTVNSAGYWQQTQTIAERQLPSGAVISGSNPQGLASQEGNSYDDFKNKSDEPTDTTDPTEPTDPTDPTGGTEWGAANITKDMFVDAQGNPKTVQEVYAELDPILTGITGEKLVNYIKDIFPKYTGVPAEEKEFAREGFKGDVYGISKDAAKVSTQMGEAYGSGMGSQIRGAVAGGKDVAQQFKRAEQVHGEDIYGLEKRAGAAYEADVLGAIGGMPEGTFAEPGADALTSSWDASWMGREGGRVPSRSETFLDVLTQLPDAGGM